MNESYYRKEDGVRKEMGGGERGHARTRGEEAGQRNMNGQLRSGEQDFREGRSILESHGLFIQQQ